MFIQVHPSDAITQRRNCDSVARSSFDSQTIRERFIIFHQRNCTTAQHEMVMHTDHRETLLRACEEPRAKTTAVPNQCQVY
jgi:hypothetical protein